MKYLLDTDTCIAILRGCDSAVKQVSRHAPDELSISSITRYELLYGVQRCDAGKRKNEKKKVQRFIEMMHELAFTGEVACLAAELRYNLESKGQAIGPMDTLIAATALHSDLILVSGNMREFDRVPNLKTQSWMRS